MAGATNGVTIIKTLSPETVKHKIYKKKTPASGGRERCDAGVKFVSI